MYLTLPSWLVALLAFVAGIFAGPRLRAMAASHRPAHPDK